jgi:hypothetical protein
MIIYVAALTIFLAVGQLTSTQAPPHGTFVGSRLCAAVVVAGIPWLLDRRTRRTADPAHEL